MARLITSGFELNDTTSAVQTTPDGGFGGANRPTIVSSPKRSGNFAASCASGAGNAVSQIIWAVTLATSTTYHFRAYICCAQLPGSSVAILQIGVAGSNGVAIRLTSTGTLQLWDSQHASQIGSDSVGTITADGSTFYRIELSMATDGSTHASTSSGYLEGTQFATGNPSGTNLIGGQVCVGWNEAPGATKTLYVDDVALNNSTGGSQNGLPGAGNVVLLVPTVDSAVGSGWTDSGGSGSNLFQSVDNEPPAGIADTTSNAGHQIRNASSAAASYDGTMTDYTTAGVPSGATVNVVDPIIATGAPVSTGAKTGSVGVVSNPNIANIALTANSNQFWTGTTAGTYVTGWKWSHGTATYAPSVTLGTAPVMRVTITGGTASRIAMVCFMGMYVDYTPAVSSFIAAPLESRLQAVPRASLW